MIQWINSVKCVRNDDTLVLWRHGDYHYEVERKKNGLTYARSTYLNTSYEQALEILETIRNK